MSLLALDFDGVISDSAPEAFLVALRTWCELSPGTALAPRAAELAGDRAPTLDRVRSSPIYADFLEQMPLGNRAEDYAVVLAAIEAGRVLADQEEYDAFRDARDAGFLERFHHRFYQVRAALAESDPQGWRGLMAPYAPFVALLRRHAASQQLAIATAKDRGSVEALLELYGVADLFPPERLLDKEAGVGKSAHLTELQRRTGLPWAEITFVDDKVNHLDGVAPLGVRCVLAGWGYNGPREAALASRRGYPTARLEDAETLLFGS